MLCGNNCKENKGRSSRIARWRIIKLEVAGREDEAAGESSGSRGVSDAGG